MPTIHERIQEIFQNKRGQDFTTGEIIKMVQRKYPDIKEGSILPNDHSNEGNINPCWCCKTEQRIFDKIDRGLYRVR